MFSFFKKKSADRNFYAPAIGILLNLSQVSESVFADRLLGDGYAVEPSTGEIYSPVEGEITTIFQPSMLLESIQHRVMKF